MLAAADTDVTQVLRVFGARAMEVGLLVPTATGLRKSIMDATGPFRAYLTQQGIHDYSKQSQGPTHKRTLPGYLVYSGRAEPTTVTLYRPETKRGDSRIWFHRMKGFARPGNLLAVVWHQGAMHLLNCSEYDLAEALDDPTTSPGKLRRDMQEGRDAVVYELLDMLHKVANRGFIPTVREGDTGVGATLEAALGIAPNNRRAPDYRGIELKAARQRMSLSRFRSTLFSRKPNWDLSPVGNAKVLLNRRGYRNGVSDRLQLYHQLDAMRPNSLGLYLEVDGDRDWLKQMHSGQRQISHDATWDLETLRGALRRKHAQTIWVKATTRNIKKTEEFHYYEAQYTKEPMVGNFVALIDNGTITLDYTLSEKQSGEVNDHGYLFKIDQRDLAALFPPSLTYSLGGR
mgnify:CR=1 FL=1